LIPEGLKYVKEPSLVIFNKRIGIGIGIGIVRSGFTTSQNVKRKQKKKM